MPVFFCSPSPTSLAHNLVRAVVCRYIMRAATPRVSSEAFSARRLASRRLRGVVPTAVASNDVSLSVNNKHRVVSWCASQTRSIRPRASDGGSNNSETAKDSTPSSKATMSALDALLGSTDTDEPMDLSSTSEIEKPKPVPDASKRDAKATVSVPLSSVRVALSEELANDDKKNIKDLSPIEMYDPEFDPLGLGPQWVVPWGGLTMFLTLLAVESGFYFAGALAPAIVYSNVRDAEEIPLDNPESFAKDLQNVFDDPASFSDIIVTAEVIQTVIALSVVGAVVSSKAPLPPGWFQFSIFGEEIDVDGGFPLEESEEIKAKGGIEAGITKESNKMATKKRRAMALQREKSNDWGGEALRAVGLTWLAVGLVTWLAYALGLRGADIGTASNSVIEKAFAAGPGGAFSLFLTTVVLAPVLEETVFRGFLLPSLTKWMSTPLAVVVSTVIFALVHEHNTGDTAQLVAVGAMAGVSYARTRNLATSITVHASFNLGVLVLFALWTRS